ncbi:DUF1643 domain-containing protein [Paenibacillus rhizovicinus]|uniref:DUF1643 domain-containing protein n=1 Tax=Paenibacillus rhizovicinus TaxID=2704463 RepID=A0A6C0P4Q6_9BACL|nr:DUF1643 domain-containing protein [Paenibacillus rhizovicinus]QHW33236.1 DUF1643 domain-containing protein [Paenibacillus rhizovicinus]
MRLSAIFDEQKMYRYSLTREWDTGLPRLLYIMLNPSTASEVTEDQTSKQCLFFAKKLGFGSFEVVNLFSFISTNPQKLIESMDPIGKDNDKHIIEAAARSETIVAAWGEKHFLNKRNQVVMDMLQQNGFELFCLMKTKSGHPRHPSRLKHDIRELIPLF